jgi:RNA polymerase sigma-70 factor (ECF subfamily)
MNACTSKLSRETLHEELLPRVAWLRRYVHAKIPTRLSATVSADDILQEVWMAAYRTVSTFTPDGPNAVERWLVTIAKSKVVDAIRTARQLKRGGDRRQLRNAQRRLTSFSELFARIQSPQKTPSGEFGAIEVGHAVSIALNLLGEDRRQAIQLHYIEGLSHKEIAGEMGKTEAAVNSLVYNGLRELRSLLGDAAKYFSDIYSSDVDELAEQPIG